jgi:hypothetical protein
LSNPEDRGYFAALPLKPTSTLSQGSEDDLRDRLAGLDCQISR